MNIPGKNKVEKVVITQDENDPVEVAVIAKSIVRLDESAQRLQSSGLKQEAIITLLHDMSKVNKSTIRTVLNDISRLRSHYCSN